MVLSLAECNLKFYNFESAAAATQYPPVLVLLVLPVSRRVPGYPTGHEPVRVEPQPESRWPPAGMVTAPGPPRAQARNLPTRAH
eukprot:3880429-Rhodomonas_salina.2